jgi:trigger factor
MEVLIESTPLDIPKAMVTQEAQRMQQQMVQDMQQRGPSMGAELPAALFEEQAKRRVHLGLLVAEIIKRESLTAEESKVRETIAEFAESYENPEEVVEHYMADQAARGSIENLVLENGVVDWVLSQVKVEEEQKRFADVMENTQ